MPRGSVKLACRTRLDYADWGAAVQSVTTMRRALRCLGLGAALAVALSGCGLSSVTSGLGSSIFGGGSPSGSQPENVSEEQLLAAAKTGGDASLAGLGSGDSSPGCPRFVVWPRDNNLTI